MDPSAPEAEGGELCRLHVGSRAGLAVVGGVVSEAADALGLPSGERAGLRALVQQVLDVVVADSFPADTSIDLDVVIERRPGGMAVVLTDRGAPSSLTLGNYPPQIAELIRLGFADDLSVSNRGREGNRTEILRRLHYRLATDDVGFEAAASADVALELGHDGQPELDIRPMVEADVFEVARLFYRTYGYSAYHATAVYEPDLLAEYVRAGRHLATVAVTPSGRVVGHVASKVERAGDVTGSLGLLAVDPAYRGFAVTARLGWAHVARLVESGFVGQYTEAVTVHDRSQRIALKSGGHEVGLILAAQGAGLEYAGFEIAPDQRRAVMMMFGGIGPIGERVVHVPQAYAEVARAVYLACGLPREVDPGSPRKPEAAEGQTRFRLHFKLEGGVAMLTVEEYGDDFDSALQQQLAKLRLNRYDLTLVMLPLGDPRTAFYGNGLDSLGLSFAGVYPEYDNGDVLVLQSLNNVEIHPDSIATASEHGEYIKAFVLDDVRRAAEFTARQQRSQANIARVLDALG